MQYSIDTITLYDLSKIRGWLEIMYITIGVFQFFGVVWLNIV